MRKNIQFFFRELTQKLWFKPLVFCIISVTVALLAQFADESFIAEITPDIERSSVEDLLSTISASMLVIAIFAVGAMISAFSAASSTATPRSFTLVVADDVSQNALSIFIGSFIYSIVASIALKNGLYGEAGYFTLFILTLAVFAIVIFIFLRWVERISKLGRLGHTISKVEEATLAAFKERKANPRMGGIALHDESASGIAVYSDVIGYVQHIDMDALQALATTVHETISVNAMPGTFTSPDKPIMFLNSTKLLSQPEAKKQLLKSFIIKDNRSFYKDPRFGLIALSEIASRALSPGINDPGTAIAIINSHVRIFSFWLQNDINAATEKIHFDRVAVPSLALMDMFDDAFRPIARDGAGNLEVMMRLQKSLVSISFNGTPDTLKAILFHSRQAFERAELQMEYSKDLEVLKNHSAFNILNA